jgi:hypothetical protein
VDNTPPTQALITSPAKYANVSGTIQIRANAADALTGVKNVSFWLDSIGGKLIGIDLFSPFSINWNTITNSSGTHDLYVRVFDFANNPLNNLTAITVTVDNNPPITASITSPITKANLSSIITISATAADNVGGTGVKNVTFWRDGIGTGVNLGVDKTSPYAINWDTTTASNANHTLQIRVFDFAGNYKDSSIVSVTVDNLVLQTMWVVQA